MSILKKASIETGLSIEALVSLARSAPRRYKEFPIPKNSGNGLRWVAQPAKELKILQRWLVSDVLADMPVHDAAYAYVKGRSIYRNAAKHVNNNFLLKLDFENFFPSIKDTDFELHLNEYYSDEISDDEVWFMKQLLFWKRRGTSHLQLCIGGPSSPHISNTIMFDFDTLISLECDKLGVTYTRYADDLAFSTNKPNILGKIPKTVVSMCKSLEYPSLRLNELKSVSTSKKHKRLVTGLILSSEGNVSMGRERKREIRSMIYKFKNSQLPKSDAPYLRGLIAFAIDVEPEFIERMNTKYGAETIDSILRGND